MARTIFVTGTDTEIGKTHVACGLVRAARNAGLRVAVYKPVAAGCVSTENGLRNDDALALIAAAGGALDYDIVNPYALVEPIAPHLAAAATDTQIDPEHLARCHQQLAQDADLVVVEGAGGWAVPLTERVAFSDWVAQHQWPVLLVVGMRLGCLNHALLSAESILRRTSMQGWVANCLPPRQPRLEENIGSLVARMPAPYLGAVGEDQPADQQRDFLKIYRALQL